MREIVRALGVDRPICWIKGLLSCAECVVVAAKHVQNLSGAVLTLAHHLFEACLSRILGSRIAPDLVSGLNRDIHRQKQDVRFHNG